MQINTNLICCIVQLHMLSWLQCQKVCIKSMYKEINMSQRYTKIIHFLYPTILVQWHFSDSSFMVPYFHQLSAMVQKMIFGQNCIILVPIYHLNLKNYARTAFPNCEFREQHHYQSIKISPIFNVQLALFWCK